MYSVKKRTGISAKAENGSLFENILSGAGDIQMTNSAGRIHFPLQLIVFRSDVYQFLNSLLHRRDILLHVHILMSSGKHQLDPV